MLAVIGLHCGLKSCKRSVNLLVARSIFLSAGNPEYDYAVAAVLLLEVLNVLAQVLGVVPAGIGRHCPKRIGHAAKLRVNQILGILGIEAGLHRLDALQFVTNRFDVLFLEYLAVECALVCVICKYVPCAENNIIETCQRNDITYMFVLFFLPASHTHLA